MPNAANMSIDEERKYLKAMQERYGTLDKSGQLLDEMKVVTGKHRKSLTRLMNGTLERKPRKTQRSRTYGSAVDDAIRVISESSRDQQTGQSATMTRELGCKA